MKLWNIAALGVWSGLAVGWTAGIGGVRAAETNAESQMRLLQQQNDALQAQVRKQQELIESLGREVAEIRQTNEKRDAAVEQLKEGSGSREPYSATAPGGFNLGKVQITGEGGVAFLESGSDGNYPNSEFRVSEARLFIDAPVWGDVYAFGEVNLATPESDSLNVKLGELYVDFEDVSQLWGHDRQLNVRAGRMYVPFGDEYLRRHAIDNPLVSDSLSDIWGVDEGVELYGSFGKFSYAGAVMNGGVPATHDFDADKALTLRLSYDPKPWLHFSLSGMRTGDLNAQEDYFSELWFGNWWFQSLGSSNTTEFHANLFEGDIGVRLPRGYLHAFGGYVYYGDNDPAGHNGRDVYYYCVEAVHDITRKLYAAGRFSQILAAKGFAIVGNGNAEYSGPTTLTTDLWLLSVGLGYRFSKNLVIKMEYSFEQGKELGGEVRKHENLFATQAAFAF